MAEPAVRSVCVRCGGDKELPLARCAECGHVPARAEAAISVLASTRVLPAAELDEVQRRIRRGEALRPSAARLATAVGLLREGGGPPPRRLSLAEEGGLAALSVFLTPLPAVAAAWAWRDTPAAQQALRAGAIGLVLNFVLIVVFLVA